LCRSLVFSIVMTMSAPIHSLQVGPCGNERTRFKELLLVVNWTTVIQGFVITYSVVATTNLNLRQALFLALTGWLGNVESFC
jgi:hypothetical protein